MHILLWFTAFVNQNRPFSIIQEKSWPYMCHTYFYAPMADWNPIVTPYLSDSRQINSNYAYFYLVYCLREPGNHFSRSTFCEIVPPVLFKKKNPNHVWDSLFIDSQNVWRSDWLDFSWVPCGRKISHGKFLRILPDLFSCSLLKLSPLVRNQATPGQPRPQATPRFYLAAVFSTAAR